MDSITLSKKAKVLENRRCEIEAQNEQLKVWGETLNSKINFTRMKTNSLEL